MKHDTINLRRRRLLLASTTLLGSIGLGGAGLAFVESVLPSARERESVHRAAAALDDRDSGRAVPELRPRRLRTSWYIILEASAFLANALCRRSDQCG